MKKILLVFAIHAGIACIAQVPTNGLINYYSFTGNANDVSGNNYHGTVHNATLVNDRFGNPNSAYNFSNTGYIDCNNILNGNLSGAGKKFSLSFWIKPDNTNQNNIIIAKHADAGCAGNDRQFFIRALNDQINVEYYGDNQGNNGRFLCGSTNITNFTKWYHVVITYDGTISSNDGLNRVKIFIDKKIETTTLSCRVQAGSFPFDMISGNAHFGIGAYLNNSGIPCMNNTYKGAIDDIRIYERIVTDVEIEQLFNESLCFKTITVTDTLLINTTITNFNPLTYNNTIRIYPNPAKDHLTIDFGNYSKLNGYKIRIDNSLGQKVYETLINTQQTVVDLATWTGKGLYFVYTIDDTGHILDVKKIVLQ